MEELEGADDEAGYQELEDALQQAAYGEADAMRERDSAMRQAQRDIEDILFRRLLTLLYPLPGRI